MKKIVSMVGIGAMVATLGLGSAFAQQQSTAPSSGTVSSGAVTTPKPGVPADMEKDKGSVVKSGEVKSDKMAPAKPADDKAPAPAGKSDAAGQVDKGLSGPSGMAPTTGGGVTTTPNNPAPAKPSDDQATVGKTTDDKAATGKASTDTKVDTKAPAKP